MPGAPRMNSAIPTVLDKLVAQHPGQDCSVNMPAVNGVSLARVGQHQCVLVDVHAPNGDSKRVRVRVIMMRSNLRVIVNNIRHSRTGDVT